VITVQHIRAMAAYNRWQNGNLYGAAETLTDAQRREDRGAFFGSIHGTLNHLLWADQIWMSRFSSEIPPPPAKRPSESTTRYESWADLVSARTAFDATIIDWAARLDPTWLQGDLTWLSGSAGRDVTKPKWLLVTHMFNHQTHHRGQVQLPADAAGCEAGPHRPAVPDAVIPRSWRRPPIVMITSALSPDHGCQRGLARQCVSKPPPCLQVFGAQAGASMRGPISSPS
jgi:uncharacterized damage-inducible protein DinB